MEITLWVNRQQSPKTFIIVVSIPILEGRYYHPMLLQDINLPGNEHLKHL
jgi:hypothetical protein